jgi:riboflavin biosynthesis pyrimidine reductase
VRQLLPEPLADVDPVAAHAGRPRPAAEERPWVLLNMIASVDGATAVDGMSGGLGGEADKAVFRALRAVPDLVLVGAGTIQAEHYGPVRTPPEIQELRVDRGQAPRPRIAVITGRLQLDLGLPLFTEAGDDRPLIVTTAAGAARAADGLDAVADLVVAGDETVDLATALANLRAEGTGVVLGEGGPSLNGSLVAAGLVDELNLSLSPTVAGGDSSRIVRGAPPAIRPLELDLVLEQDGLLFLRYVTAG